jgi:hypothetical protein
MNCFDLDEHITNLTDDWVLKELKVGEFAEEESEEENNA